MMEAEEEYCEWEIQLQKYCVTQHTNDLQLVNNAEDKLGQAVRDMESLHASVIKQTRKVAKSASFAQELRPIVEDQQALIAQQIFDIAKVDEQCQANTVGLQNLQHEIEECKRRHAQSSRQSQTPPSQVSVVQHSESTPNAVLDAECARTELHNRGLQMVCGWAPRLRTLNDGTTQEEILFARNDSTGRDTFGLVLPSNTIDTSANLHKFQRMVHRVTQLEMFVNEAKDLQKRHCRSVVVHYAHADWQQVATADSMATITMRFATSQHSPQRSSRSQFEVTLTLDWTAPFIKPTFSHKIIFGAEEAVLGPRIQQAIENVPLGYGLVTRVYEALMMMI